MTQYIQNFILDNRPQARNVYYPNEDEVIGFEIRKKGSIWSALTGKKQKPEYVFFEQDIRPRQEVVLYNRGYCDSSLAVMPIAMPSLCGYHSPSPWRYRYISEEYECHGCVSCLYDRCLGPLRRPYPRRRGRGWRYDYYEHGEGWDRPPFRGLGLRRPRHRRHGRPIWRHRRDEDATGMMQREMIELMQERLSESRHERIYGEWPAGYSVDNWRRREDRVQELDDRIEDLRDFFSENGDGSDDGLFSEYSD